MYKEELPMRTVIENGWILTMDSADTCYENGYIIIEGDRITHVGKGPVPADLLAGASHVDAGGSIVMPGMINTHCHVSMIPFRTMGDDCPDRLRRFLFPLEEKAVTPQLVYWGALYGIAEMLLSGITTFLDMYYFEDQVAEACRDAGIRGFLGETVIGQKTCDSELPYGGLDYGREFIQKWKGDPLVSPLIAPHGTNTNQPEFLEKAYALACEYDTLYTLHASEMDYEMDYFAREYHQTPTEFLHALGVLSPRTLLAHCIHMTDSDLDRIAAAGASVSHCIGSNTKAGKGVSPVKAMLERGIPVGLGTDGPSSGNTLSMFTQFRLFASFHKTENRDRSLFPARDIVRLGTRTGAKALGAADRIGTLEPGKQADIVMVERDSINMFPCYNPYSALVYSAERANVDRVWVAGQERVRHGRLTGLDEAEIRRRLLEQMPDFLEKSREFASII